MGEMQYRCTVILSACTKGTILLDKVNISLMHQKAMGRFSWQLALKTLSVSYEKKVSICIETVANNTMLCHYKAVTVFTNSHKIACSHSKPVRVRYGMYFWG